MKKIKISELPLCNSFKGLFTIGTDKSNRSVKVPLDEIDRKQNKLNVVGPGLDLSEDDELTLTARAKQMLFDDMWTAAVGSYGKVDHTHTETRDGKEVSTPYYLNELWLTYAEAIAVYDADAIKSMECAFFYHNKEIRTNLPPRLYSAQTTMNNDYKFFAVDGVLSGDNSVEVLNLTSAGFPMLISDTKGKNAIISSKTLRKVIGAIQINHCTNKNYFDAPNLNRLLLYYLFNSINLSGLKKIDAPSVRYLIENKYPFHPCSPTVTVHKNVYAKLTADEENEAYASLSIQEKNEWSPLLELAESKNITFASA